MIGQILFSYIFNRWFLVQTITTLTVYIALRSATLLAIRLRRHKLFKHYGIPGPEPSWLDGSLRVLMKDRAIFKVEEEMVKKYGRVFGVYLGDEPRIIVTDLEMLRKIFFEETKSFKLRTVLYVESVLSSGILFAKYDRWKLMRKIMTPPFSHYTIRGDSSTQFVEDSIKLMIEYIDNKLLLAKSSGKEANIDIHDLMKATALHLISSMAIRLPNVRVRENEDNVKSLDSYLDILDQSVALLAIKYPVFLPLIQFLENHFEYSSTMALIHKGLSKLIDNKLVQLSSNKASKVDKNQRQDIMGTLIELHHENLISRKEVLSNAVSLLFAGYDTTSTTLAYLIWVIAKYPDVQEKLRLDLMTHGIGSKYLEQVINETMRLYPTVTWFTTRMATTSVVIDNWVIPQGARVVYDAYLIHRDPEIWPDPLKFDPERFREGAAHHPCAFAPFGLGERKCIGFQLALLEMRMIICDLLLRYRFHLNSPENLDLISIAFILTKPKDKVMVRMEKL